MKKCLGCNGLNLPADVPNEVSLQLAEPDPCVDLQPGQDGRELGARRELFHLCKKVGLQKKVAQILQSKYVRLVIWTSVVDPDPEVFSWIRIWIIVPNPESARMREQINKNFIYTVSFRPEDSGLYIVLYCRTVQ